MVTGSRLEDLWRTFLDDLLEDLTCGLEDLEDLSASYAHTRENSNGLPLQTEPPPEVLQVLQVLQNTRSEGLEDLRRRRFGSSSKSSRATHTEEAERRPPNPPKRPTPTARPYEYGHPGCPPGWP